MKSFEVQRTKPNGTKKGRASCKDMQPRERAQKTYMQQYPGERHQSLPKSSPDKEEKSTINGIAGTVRTA